jgi:serine/threonine-protein phosphatase 5
VEFMMMSYMQLTHPPYQIQGFTVTIFSASNYVDQVGNKGAFARIDPQGTIEYIQFDAQPHPDLKPMHYSQSPMSGMVG